VEKVVYQWFTLFVFTLSPWKGTSPLANSSESVYFYLTPSPEFIPIPVVMEGQIIDHNLKYLKKDRKWLEGQLFSYSLSMNELAKSKYLISNNLITKCKP
jgi:hypothetical protein